MPFQPETKLPDFDALKVTWTAARQQIKNYPTFQTIDRFLTDTQKLKNIFDKRLDELEALIEVSTGDSGVVRNVLPFDPRDEDEVEIITPGIKGNRGDAGLTGERGLAGPPGIDGECECESISSILGSNNGDGLGEFLRLSGRGGGQIANGGVNSGDDLTLSSTTNATKGSIFIGTASVYDEVNNRLGLGTLSPDEILHMLTDGGASTWLVDTFADSAIGNRIQARTSRGSVASPTASLLGDSMFTFQCFGRASAGAFSGEVGQLLWFAAENFSASANGSTFRIKTVPITTTTLTTALTIDNQRNAIIGGANGPSTGSEGLFMDNGTVPSSLDSRTSGIYSLDVAGTVELQGIDAGGTTTQLTPHNFTLFMPDINEPFPWDYHSVNPYLGVEINCDITKLARLVEQLTGETLIYTRPIPRRNWWNDRETHANLLKEQNIVWERHQNNGIPTPLDKPESPITQIKRPPAWLYDRLKAQNLHEPQREAELRARFARS